MIERIENLDDLPEHQLIALGNEFLTEAGESDPFDYSHMRKHLMGLMRLGLAAMWVSRRDGKVVGAISGIIFPILQTGKLAVIETFWFVTKSCRGVDGLRLLGELEQWARQNEAKRFIVAHMEGIHPEGMAAFYQRRGFRKLETNFVLDMN